MFSAVKTPILMNRYLNSLLILLLAGTFGHSAVYAQTPTSFPDDDAGFVEVFSAYVSKSNRENSRIAAAAFTGAYNNMSADMKAVLRETGNAMLKNKVRNYPVFTEFAELVAELHSRKGEVPQDHFLVLRDLIEAAKPSAYKQFESYMEYLPELMEHNALYMTNTKLWSFGEGATYSAGVEDGRPYLEFDRMDLYAQTKRDTLVIFQTSGRAYPVDRDYVGKDGILYFTRPGWLQSEAKAELSEFTLGMDKVDFVFDSVQFTMPQFLDGKVMGSVQDKLYTTIPRTINNPEFTSYDTDLMIKNIDERISTAGGFRLEGTKVIVRGDRGEQAVMRFATSGQRQAEVHANRFLIDMEDQEIYAENAHFIAFMKKDSIHHPSLIFRYFMEDDVIEVRRSEGLTSNLPFKSGYHLMNMGINTMMWDLDSSHIDVRTVSVYTESPVTFTSYDHYIPGGELKYQTLTGRNTLQMIRELSDSYGTTALSGEAVAGMMGYPLRQIENVLFKLTKDGFIHYDTETKMLEVDYKTFHYLDAGTGEFDFDHLQFVSDPPGNINGRIELDSQSLVIKGVGPFDLSKVKRVKLTPKDGDIVLKEDRDIDMAGKLTAAQLEFKGTGMYFDYDPFNVDMQAVDSMIIKVKGPEMNYEGIYPDIPLKSVISDIKGTLYIDDPGNKSGRYDYAEYPYFESYDTAYVYFDANYDTIRYPRDKFYFAIYPFTLDSISNIVADSLQFYGRFVSGDIFDPFETVISVQPDYTLGIDEFTPPEGLAIYDSKAIFNGNYRLLKDGLFGNGTVSIGPVNMRSPKFEFFNDSSHAKLDSLYIVADAVADLPSVTNTSAEMFWWPYRDSAFIQRTTRNFRLYDGQLEYDGNLRYTDGDLYGAADTAELANHRIEGAKVKAALTEFTKDYFEAYEASVELDKEGDTELIQTEGVTAKMDMVARLGNFRTDGDSVITIIEGNQLITNYRDFEWDMDAGKVTFKNDAEGQYVFTSTLPAYDSLTFNAGQAIYDLNENITDFIEVKQVGLADSKLIPAGKTLKVETGGRIEQLEGATLILNDEEEYHRIDNTTLQIRSRTDFDGTGTYAYETVGGMPFTIAIDQIKVSEDTTGQTESRKKSDEPVDYVVHARGVIPESDGFRLDEQLLFKGNALIASNDKDIAFKGYGKVDLKQNPESSWFGLNQGIDPENFSIALDSLIDETKQLVVTGLYVSPGELEVYPAVMNPKRSPRDPALHQVTGSLYKGENTGEFVFGEESAVTGEDPAGSLMYYDDNTGAVTVDGAMTLISDIPLVKADAYGKMDYDPATGYANGKMSIAIDFPLDESLWYQLPRDMVEYAYESKELNYDRPEIKRALRHFITSENSANVVIDDIEAEGLFQMPSSFDYKMLLTDVDLKWDPVDGNFKGVGDIGVSTINNYPIDLQVKAYTEFGYSLGTSYMNLFFETISGEWYFFSTKRGKMYVLSSDQSFNDAVVNSDDKEVRDGKKGPIIYEFQPGNTTSRLTFMTRFEDYLIRTGQSGE